MGRILTRVFSIPYSFSVPPGAGANQSSNIITNVQQLIGAMLIFPVGTGSLFYYQFIEAGVKPLSTALAIGGRDINSEVINPGLYVGDGVVYPVPWQKKPIADSEYLVMNAINGTNATLQAAAVAWITQ